jgi:hypothetical protein
MGMVGPTRQNHGLLIPLVPVMHSQLNPCNGKIPIKMALATSPLVLYEMIAPMNLAPPNEIYKDVSIITGTVGQMTTVNSQRQSPSWEKTLPPHGSHTLSLV